LTFTGSAFKRVSVEIGRQVHLLCPWASKALNGTASTFEC